MDQMTQFKDKDVRLNKNVTHSCDETHLKHEVENKIIEKNTPHQLSTQKASVPRTILVKWNLKAKSDLFTRDKVYALMRTF